jgi:hypothetical protein
MDIDPPLSVSLSRPTFHALRLVARIDEIALEEIVETLVAAYVETRLRAIQRAESSSRGVLDLAARIQERSADSASSQRSTKRTRRRRASQR